MTLPLFDPDAALRRDLQRHKMVATGLLALMAVLTLGTYAMPPGWGTDLLQASAKAGRAEPVPYAVPQVCHCHSLILI